MEKENEKKEDEIQNLFQKAVVEEQKRLHPEIYDKKKKGEQ